MLSVRPADPGWEDNACRRREEGGWRSYSLQLQVIKQHRNRLGTTKPTSNAASRAIKPRNCSGTHFRLSASRTRGRAAVPRQLWRSSVATTWSNCSTVLVVLIWLVPSSPPFQREGSETRSLAAPWSAQRLGDFFVWLLFVRASAAIGFGEAGGCTRRFPAEPSAIPDLATGHANCQTGTCCRSVFR
jgi:hypothetical protein